MPHERFFLADPLEKAAILKGTEFHHLANVLRVRIGDEVELVNGEGALALARVEKIEKDAARLLIVKREQYMPKTPLLYLGLSLIRMNKLEWTIEKGVEIGADAFHLFPADYSEKDTINANQLERLFHLSVAALKQCGRLYLPKIVVHRSLKEALETDAVILFGDTDPNAPKLIRLDATKILFCTGPEKGFSLKETELLKEKGQGVKLHANILRAETAPLVALSLLSQFY